MYYVLLEFAPRVMPEIELSLLSSSLPWQFCKIQNKVTSTIYWLFGASQEHICGGVSGKSCNEQILQLLMIITHRAFTDNPNNKFLHIRDQDYFHLFYYLVQKKRTHLRGSEWQIMQ